MHIDKITTENGIAEIIIDGRMTTIEVDSPVTTKAIEINTWQDLNKIEAKPAAKKSIIDAILKKTGFAHDTFGKVQQVPRPITIIAQNNEIFLAITSLNAKSITKALWANETVHKAYNDKFLSFKKEILSKQGTTENMLEEIQDILEKTQIHLEFKLQPAIIFKEPTTKERAQSLIEKYNICYIENCCKEDEYKDLSKEVMHRCFVAAITKRKLTNGFAQPDANITEILQTKQDKQIPFVHITTKKDLEITTGCGVPMIIFSIENRELTKAIEAIEQKIRTSSN